MGSISRILLVASITGSLLSCGWSLVGPLQRHWTALCLAIGPALARGASVSPQPFEAGAHRTVPSRPNADNASALSGFRIGHQPATVLGGMPAQGPAAVQPLDLRGVQLRNAGAGIEAQALLLVVHQEIEGNLAIEEFEHLAAQFVHHTLRVVTVEQPAGRFSQQLGPPLGAFAPRDILFDRHKMGDFPAARLHRRDGYLFGMKRAVLAAVDQFSVPGFPLSSVLHICR